MPPDDTVVCGPLTPYSQKIGLSARLRAVTKTISPIKPTIEALGKSCITYREGVASQDVTAITLLASSGRNQVSFGNAASMDHAVVHLLLQMQQT